METNSPKQKARLAKVKAMLASGENPYSTIEGGAKDQGGLDKDRADRARELRTERSEARTKELEEKWKERPRVIPVEVVYFEEDIFGPMPIRDKAKLYCTFCGTEVDRVNATHGRGQPRKLVIEELRRVHGQLTIHEEVKHMVDKTVACPSCVNQVTHIIFPETEG